MNYKIAVHTDIGTKKDTNQDSCCIKLAATDKGNVVFALLCDGMGGLSKGEVASAELIKHFSDWFEQRLPYILALTNPIEEVRFQWNRMIKEKNQDIAAYGRSLHLQLGSTLTAMLILENGDYIIGHVGDSRAYRITDSTLSLLTEDQTVVAREIKAGRLTPEQAENDPRRSVLLQCVGASKIVDPAFYYGRISPDECYMLCSDGFRHTVSPREMYDAFCPRSNADEAEMKEHLAQLVELNKSRFEIDNITAMLIKTESED